MVKAVQFAGEHNLRIAVKNTGHDYHGKSTIEGGLSLWTHNIKYAFLSLSLLSFLSFLSPFSFLPFSLSPFHPFSISYHQFSHLFCLMICRDIKFEDNFVPSGCNQCSGQSVVSVGPGVQWYELMPAADAHVCLSLCLFAFSSLHFSLLSLLFHFFSFFSPVSPLSRLSLISLSSLSRLFFYSCQN